MKKIIFFFLVAFVTFNAEAQLVNTKWKGTIHTDSEIDVIFNYTTDTLDVVSAGDGSSIETMTYSIKDSTLNLQKINGQSDCDGSAAAYKFVIKDNLMYITLISDNCNGRSSVLNGSKWTKIE